MKLITLKPKMKNSKYAIDQIYDEFKPKIDKYLSRLVGQNEAEDISQEVFMKIDQAIDKFKEKASLSTWIYKIATNMAIDRSRNKSSKKVKSIHEYQTQLIDIQLNNKNSEQAYIQQEMSDCIRDYVDALPEEFRVAFVLSEYEELMNKDIAEILDISIESVKIRLHRGKKMLKKRFQNECNFYSNEQGALSCEHKTKK